MKQWSPQRSHGDRGRGPAGSPRLPRRRALPAALSVLVLVLALAASACSAGAGPGPAPRVALPKGCRESSVPSSSPAPAAGGFLSVSSTCAAAVHGSAPAAPYFSAVAFPSPDQGWAGGRQCAPGQAPTSCPGLIEATTDGGRSWSVVYRGPRPIVALDFVDATHGFALAGNQCSGIRGVCAQVLLSTDDGGASWSTSYRAGPSSTLAAVDFTGPEHGWLALRGCPALDLQPSGCPGQILASADGGASWSVAASTAGPVLALAGAGSTGWAVAESSTRHGSGVPVDVLTTTGVAGSGAGWHLLSRVPAGYSFDAGTVAALDFSDAAHGWLSVLAPSSCAMHGCGVEGLWRTTDGGSTWAEVSPPTRRGCGGFGVVFALAPGGDLYATQGVNLATCDPPETTLFTRASGTGTWTALYDWSHAAALSMAWPRPEEGWAAAGPALLHTTDGGRAWTQAVPDLQPTTALTGAGPILWGAGSPADSGAVLRSADGGRTWTTAADLPGTVTGLSASGAELWATDWSLGVGWSLYRHSPGAGWQRIYVLGADRLGQRSPLALDMFGATGVMVSTSGPSQDHPGQVAPASVTTTADGGRSWGPDRAVPDPSLLYAASFAGPSVGWALEDDAGGQASPSVTLLATADAGGQWLTVGGLPRDLTRSVTGMGVELLASGTGLVWADQGSYAQAHLVLLVTTDGGRSWRRYDLPAGLNAAPAASGTAQPPTLWFSSPRAGWLLVPGAGVWSTTDGGLSWTGPQGSVRRDR